MNDSTYREPGKDQKVLGHWDVIAALLEAAPDDEELRARLSATEDFAKEDTQ